jgi:hypothetical protein
LTDAARSAMVVFRWSGAFWGFVDGNRLYVDTGGKAGWVEPVPGRRFTAHPYPDHPSPPDPPPAREPRVPLDDWSDALALKMTQPTRDPDREASMA